MSDALDLQVLEAVSALIDAECPAEIATVRRLWTERNMLVAALREIRDWDLGHAEALTLSRVIEIAEATLKEAGE